MMGLEKPAVAMIFKCCKYVPRLPNRYNLVFVLLASLLTNDWLSSTFKVKAEEEGGTGNEERDRAEDEGMG